MGKFGHFALGWLVGLAVNAAVVCAAGYVLYDKYSPEVGNKLEIAFEQYSSAILSKNSGFDVSVDYREAHLTSEDGHDLLTMSGFGSAKGTAYVNGQTIAVGQEGRFTLTCKLTDGDHSRLEKSLSGTQSEDKQLHENCGVIGVILSADALSQGIDFKELKITEITDTPTSQSSSSESSSSSVSS
jgi:hypothetical protein